MYSVGTPTEYDIAHSHIRAEGAHRVSNKSVIVLEICWKSVQTLISLPVRGYRPHPNRDEFGSCETLEIVHHFPFAYVVRLRSLGSYRIILLFRL